MRVLLAGLFVFGSLLAAVVLISELAPATPAWLLGLGGGGLLLSLVVAAQFLFNRSGTAFGPGRTPAQLEAEGLLVSTAYRAGRAFQTEEAEDEGSHYFLELEDGRVLYLTGQYLYNYEPLEKGETRRFPCTEFQVRHHKTGGYTMDILCGGQVLEPECLAPGFGREAFRDIPEDRQVFTDRSYDDLKKALTGSA